MRAWFLLGVLAAATACGKLLEDDTAVSPDGGGGTVDASSSDAASGDASTDGASVDAPSDVAPEKRLVFLTSAIFQGDFGSDWDTKCQTAALGAGLGGKWLAWVSTSAGRAADRIVLDVEYRTVDGRLVASGRADLLSGDIATPIDRTETDGGLGGTPYVWTGTAADGGLATPTCQDWSMNVDGTNGTVGDARTADAHWTNDVAPMCSIYAHLYCFQQ